jgi:hypothetical protein
VYAVQCNEVCRKQVVVACFLGKLMLFVDVDF